MASDVASDAGSCAEVLDEGSFQEPTEEEILEYAAFLGIDPETEAHLMWIAKEGVAAPVPHPWKACREGDDDEVFYFNFETKQSIWDHPCDEIYRELLEKERAKGLPGSETPRDESAEEAKNASGEESEDESEPEPNGDSEQGTRHAKYESKGQVEAPGIDVEGVRGGTPEKMPPNENRAPGAASCNGVDSPGGGEARDRSADSDPGSGSFVSEAVSETRQEHEEMEEGRSASPAAGSRMEHVVPDAAAHVGMASPAAPRSPGSASGSFVSDAMGSPAASPAATPRGGSQEAATNAAVAPPAAAPGLSGSANGSLVSEAMGGLEAASLGATPQGASQAGAGVVAAPSAAAPGSPGYASGSFGSDGLSSSAVSPGATPVGAGQAATHAAVAPTVVVPSSFGNASEEAATRTEEAAARADGAPKRIPGSPRDAIGISVSDVAGSAAASSAATPTATPQGGSLEAPARATPAGVSISGCPTSPGSASGSFVSEAVASSAASAEASPAATPQGSQAKDSPANASARMWERMAGGGRNSSAPSSNASQRSSRFSSKDTPAVPAQGIRSPSASPTRAGRPMSPASGSSAAPESARGPLSVRSAASSEAAGVSVPAGGERNDVSGGSEGQEQPESPKNAEIREGAGMIVSPRSAISGRSPRDVSPRSPPVDVVTVEAVCAPVTRAAGNSGTGLPPPKLDHGSISARSSNPSEVSEDFRSDWGAQSPPLSPSKKEGESLELSASVATDASGWQDGSGPAKMVLSGMPGTGSSSIFPAVPEVPDRERCESISQEEREPPQSTSKRTEPKTWQELQQDVQALASLLEGVRAFRTKQEEYARILKALAAS